ncbi:MAG: hypothetical protein ACK5O7_03670 [Holosporales bacterium]
MAHQEETTRRRSVKSPRLSSTSTPGPSRETILADLEKAYQAALASENLTAAVKIKELQLKVLGLLNAKRSPQGLRPIQQMTTEELQALLQD